NYNQRKEANVIDKLWLTVENKKPILKERNVNEGTNFIRLSEVGNLDRNIRKDSNKLPGARFLLVMKVKNVEYQIEFGEVVGNTCEHDDANMERDRKKRILNNATWTLSIARDAATTWRR
ncbi:12961_t:CDS:2, partial [Gigaspora margarita]